MTWLSLSNGVLKTNRGTPLAQLVECRTCDRKAIPGLNLTRGAVVSLGKALSLYCLYWFNPGNIPTCLKIVDLDVNLNKQTKTMQLLFEVICVISICFQASLPLFNMHW